MNTVPFSGSPLWCVVHTKPKQEFRALEQLNNQGYVCFLPTLQIEKICRAKRKICIEPLFSRYLFIRLDGMTSNWSSIHSTRGVTCLLRFGDRIATLPDEYVEALKGTQQVLLQDAFRTGDWVVVASGPFAGLKGLYQVPDGEARAMILVEMMNQPRKLSFAIETIRKAA
jgi:transcriptional antiterminator RfaH